MASGIYGQIKTAFGHLNPEQVKELAERPVKIGLIASGSEGYSALENLLLPASISNARREEVRPFITRLDHTAAQPDLDLVLCDGELLCPRGAFCVDMQNPQATVAEIIERREDLAIPLARTFQPFRRPVIRRIVRRVSRENALFSVMTALPDIVPSVIELPWAVGEFASDTAFLTMNQVRMAFLIAGASDHPVGYRQQSAQIGGIVAGAFGWRALARELVGKIPFGGGLVPKAAIAYAGTYTIGVGLERLYRLGYGLTRQERREVYTRAVERGKQIVETFVKTLSRNAQRVRPTELPEPDTQ